MTAKIESVNITEPRIITIKGKAVATSIWKRAASGKIEIDGNGIVGETRIAKSLCEPADHAVYFYPYEHYAVWQRELAHEPFPFGQFGENVTCSGILESEVRVGDVLRCGGVTVAVRQPRLPCAKLDVRMGQRFAGRFLRSRRVGFLTRVLEPGRIAAGDEIVVLDRDERAPTVDDLFRLTQLDTWDAEGLARLLECAALPAAWREIVEHKHELAREAQGWHGLRPLRVVARRGDDAVALTLVCPYGKPLAPFSAGQYVIVAWRPNPDASALRRAYAITSDPGDLSRYEIVVQRLAVAVDGQEGARGGLVSTALREQVEVGAMLWAAAPRGHTTLDGLGGELGRGVFFSEGIGVATVLPLLREWQRRFALVPVVHWHVATQPMPESISEELAGLGLRWLERRVVSELPAPAVLREVVRGAAHVFVVGSSAFSDAVEAALAGSGASLHLERFGEVR